MRIGIVGAECSHAVKIAKTINIEKQFKGFCVDYIWGETREFANQAAQAGQISNIVKKPEDMLGKIDAVVINQRHAKFHLPSAVSFLKAGVPMFIDKPFCYRLAEGKAFIKLARKYKTPVASFSAIPHQADYLDFVRQLKGAGDIMSAAAYGPCDINSKYGGVFFYGVHQVEMAIGAFGSDIKKVITTSNGDVTVVQLLYASGLIASLNLIKKGSHCFAISAYGSKKSIHQSISYDKEPYLRSIGTFLKMFKTGRQPCPYEDLLRPVAVLEAVEKSIKSGRAQTVQKVI